MLRSSAEITPTESDCCSPNGLPIAATGLAHRRGRREGPSSSGVSVRPSGSILSSATSAFGSSPTIFAGTRLPSENSTKTSLARLRRAPVAARDDVRVGGDVALAVEHEARALAALAAVLEQRRGAVEERDDRDHARARAGRRCPRRRSRPSRRGPRRPRRGSSRPRSAAGSRSALARRRRRPSSPRAGRRPRAAAPGGASAGHGQLEREGRAARPRAAARCGRPSARPAPGRSPGPRPAPRAASPV